jgi:ABC-type uncharacterized transport system permease subunit
MSGVAFRLAVVLLPVLYFALAAARSAEVGGPTALARPPLRGVVAWLAVLLHALFFFAIHVETRAFPLVIPGAALSALAFALFVVYAWVEWRSRVRGLGVYVIAAVFFLQIAASGLGFVPVGDPPAANALFITHVVTTIASVATLLLSGFFGVMYLVVEKAMRAQRFGALFARLPNLSELAAMNRRAATAGFLLMTVGYNLGIWQAHDVAMKGFSYLDPVVLITMAAWIVFGLIALSRWVRFLSGRKAAATAVCGLVLLALTIVASLVPGVSFHRLS